MSTIDVTILEHRSVLVAGAQRGPGAVVSLPVGQAETLIDAGYARLSSDPAPIKPARQAEEPLPTEGGDRLTKLVGHRPRAGRRRTAPSKQPPDAA